jgi:uncharacterized membrane protein YdjX (TVP38/TMEM64 family)
MICCMAVTLRNSASMWLAVALFSVSAGLIFGAWVDGAAWTSLAAVMGACLAGLAVALAWLRRRQRMVVAA